MLGRFWTYTVWAAWVFLAVLWIVLWYERLPLLGILQAILCVLFLLRYAWPELRGSRRENTARRAR